MGKQSKFQEEKELKAKANKIEAESLSNNLLKKMLIEKWDGKLPTTMSDSEIIKMINN